MSQLKEALIKKKISTYKLSQLLGLVPDRSSGHLEKQIRGQASLSFKNLTKICRVTKIDIKEVDYKVERVVVN